MHNLRMEDPENTSTLVDVLLDEQRDFTIVSRFARHHGEENQSHHNRLYRDLIPLTLPKKGEQYAFDVDLDKCSGCKACVTACHNLNGLDEHETWRSVTPLHGGTSAQPFQTHVTSACHHCIDPACMNGCPVLAYEKDAVTGIVHHLDDQCIGCQYCVLKCPYDVPQYHEKKGIVRKCDMCSGRLLVNEAPACVQACPNEAIRITLISQSIQALSATSHARLVPGSPASDYTMPSTLYHQAQPFPTNTKVAGLSQPAPAQSSLAVMLVFTQLSVGWFSLDLMMDFFLPASPRPVAIFPVLSAALVGWIGLLASLLHLGRPLQAWRAFLGFRKSWLSREVIAFGAFAALLAFRIASLSESPGAHNSALKGLIAAAGLIAVLCSIMVYVDTRRLAWSAGLTAPRFLGTVLLLGLSASAFLALFEQDRDPRFFLGTLVIISMAKLGWESDCTWREKAKRQASSLPTQIHVRTARLFAGVLGGILLPALLFSSSLTRDLFAWLVAASFLLCLLGELLERHLFFTGVGPTRIPSP